MLTDLACRTAVAGERKILKLSDGRGLYLWVYADTRKYWRFRYTKAGKEQSLSLGVYPEVGLKEARLRCEAERLKLRNHQDPSNERKAVRRQAILASENSFGAVASEWFDKQSKVWSETHKKDVQRRLEKNILPDLGARPIDQIEAPELLNVMRRIEARGATDLAKRVLGMCGQIFRYGVATGRCKHDLSADLRGALSPHVRKNQNAIKPEELPELMRAIASYHTIGDRQTQIALQLLAHTFVRTSELIEATWDEIDTSKKLWVIPATRMKNKHEHRVPLSAQVISLLEQQSEVCGGSQFVFPGRSREKPISNNTVLFALYGLGYKGRMSGHGFRSVASTYLNEHGFRHDVIERQLAHIDKTSVRGAYNRAEYMPERTQMMQDWSDHLESLVDEYDQAVVNGELEEWVKNHE